MSITAGQKLLRARKYDSYHAEKTTQELSYIEKSNAHLSKIGRFNGPGNPVYYGCLYFNDDHGGNNVGFSEIHVSAGQIVNVLRSTTTSDIEAYYLGIYDCVSRQQKPWFMDEFWFEKFEEVYEYQKKVFSEELFVAHQLCDAFFSDIFRRKGTDQLYSVTSLLAESIFKDTSADGLIYGSVEAEGSPVIALSTTSVDRKITHSSAEVYEITRNFGYGIYRAILKNTGKVTGNSIDWSN